MGVKHMRKALLWIGGLLGGTGVALIAASVVLSHMGLAASYNFGDPAKFEFRLVPLWQIGAGVALVGLACLAATRWLGTRRA
jgi:hypothetical protein